MESLIAVHAASEDDVWAIAEPSTLLHGTATGLWPVLTSDRPLTAVARLRGAVYVAVEDAGLFRFEDGELGLVVKDTFKPRHLEAREGLLCVGGESVVGTDDGVMFQGTTLKAVSAMINARPPTWT